LDDFYGAEYDAMDAGLKLLYKVLINLAIVEVDYLSEFKRTRGIGLATSLVGVAGAATAFVAPGLFPIFTYVSALGGFGVLF